MPLSKEQSDKDTSNSINAVKNGNNISVRNNEIIRQISIHSQMVY